MEENRRVPKPKPRILVVSRVRHLTPHMIRVTFAGNELEGFPEGREGSNCKILLPEPGEGSEAFSRRLVHGPVPVRRTYTVRHFRQGTSTKMPELDIDFVDHGDAGPASAWARAAGPGDILGFLGPGPKKVTHFESDYFLVAADMSALPVAAATLEEMPRDAKGAAFFEITGLTDVYPIDAPAGVELQWIIHPDPSMPSNALVDAVRALPWPSGRVQTCIAGEHSAIKALRDYVIRERGTPKADAYVAGYWKIGLIEDQHQELKRTNAA